VPNKARSLIASAALMLCCALLAIAPPAGAQVLVLQSDAHTRALTEALRIQFSGRAPVRSVAAPGRDLPRYARRWLESRAARLVLWIGEDDSPEPGGDDYLLSVARSLVDGPGVEIVRLPAQTGALGDRAVALRVAELYPSSAAPPLKVRAPKDTPPAAQKRSRLQAAAFVQAQSTLTPAAPGLEVGYRIPFRSLRLIPELAGWWLAPTSITQNQRRLELSGVGFGTGLQLLKELARFDVGASVTLSWQAHLARGEASDGTQGHVTEWIPAIVPHAVLALRWPQTPVYVGVRGGVAWSLVQQSWWVDEEKLRQEPRLAPSVRVMVGAIF
jgi:hypothetical protein